MPVKFTDIDYFVFKDAAQFILNGQSPYKRATYRYTPLLAMIMTPSAYFDLYGKLLFCSCDLIAGWLMYSLLSRSGVATDIISKLTGFVWILNPFVAVISARGNCESILSVLALLTLYLLKKGRLNESAVVYGFACHFKIYPLLYAIPLWFGLDHYMSNDNRRSSKFSFKLFSRNRARFGFISAFTFFALNYAMYRL